MPNFNPDQVAHQFTRRQKLALWIGQTLKGSQCEMALLARLVVCVSVITTIVNAQVAQAALGDAKSVALRTHSLHAPYLDSDLQSRWFDSFLAPAHLRWDFGGSTVVDTNK